MGTAKQDDTQSGGLRLCPSLLWLADAPLFIDDKLVDRFYDAVVQPQNEQMTTTLELSEAAAKKASVTGSIQANITPSDLLMTLTHVLPFLKISASASGQGTGETSNTKSNSTTIQLKPIKTPQRQLVNLALHYLANQPERLYLEGNPSDSTWRASDFITKAPRALVFLDLPGQDAQAGGAAPSVTTKLIPTAAEFSNGKVVTLFDLLRSQNGRESPPVYPGPAGDTETQHERQLYWQWFDTNFDATQAMQVIEDTASVNGRIRWIDFRLPISADGDTLHLHISPAEAYDTGSFAYQLVKRGYKHGLRIVGTLKSEPDLNVLAIYEK